MLCVVACMWLLLRCLVNRPLAARHSRAPAFPPRSFAAPSPGARRYYRYGVMLKKVANFYNTMDGQILPTQKFMLCVRCAALALALALAVALASASASAVVCRVICCQAARLRLRVCAKQCVGGSALHLPSALAPHARATSHADGARSAPPHPTPHHTRVWAARSYDSLAAFENVVKNPTGRSRGGRKGGGAVTWSNPQECQDYVERLQVRGALAGVLLLCRQLYVCVCGRVSVVVVVGCLGGGCS